eukprot:30001-Pyramimonas_sp.AAC.1
MDVLLPRRRPFAQHEREPEEIICRPARPNSDYSDQFILLLHPAQVPAQGVGQAIHEVAQ